MSDAAIPLSAGRGVLNSNSNDVAGFEATLNGCVDGIRRHAHQQRQRLRGHIVRPLRRTARIHSHVGIMLPLQQRLGVAAVGLLHADDVAAFRVALSAGGECIVRALDLHFTEAQQLQHLSRRARIHLRARNHERIGRCARHRPLAHFVEISQQIRAPQIAAW